MEAEWKPAAGSSPSPLAILCPTLDYIPSKLPGEKAQVAQPRLEPTVALGKAGWLRNCACQALVGPGPFTRGITLAVHTASRWAGVGLCGANGRPEGSAHAHSAAGRGGRGKALQGRGLARLMLGGFASEENCLETGCSEGE